MPSLRQEQQQEVHGCSGRVWRSGAMRSTACEKNGVYERDGKWYCRRHDPRAKAGRDKAWSDRFNAEFTATEEASKAMAAWDEAVERALLICVPHGAVLGSPANTEARTGLVREAVRLRAAERGVGRTKAWSRSSEMGQRARLNLKVAQATRVMEAILNGEQLRARWENNT